MFQCFTLTWNHGFREAATAFYFRTKEGLELAYVFLQAELLNARQRSPSFLQRIG